jgi:hypothetical protein
MNIHTVIGTITVIDTAHKVPHMLIDTFDPGADGFVKTTIFVPLYKVKQANFPLDLRVKTGDTMQLQVYLHNTVEGRWMTQTILSVGDTLSEAGKRANVARSLPKTTTVVNAKAGVRKHTEHGRTWYTVAGHERVYPTLGEANRAAGVKVVAIKSNKRNHGVKTNDPTVSQRMHQKKASG